MANSVTPVPTRNTALEFEWMRTWWDVYGEKYGGRDALRILCVRRSGRLVAALPLYSARTSPFGERRWRFLGTGEEEYEEICPDYLDLLSLPGEDRPCTNALADFLATCGGWDALQFDDMAITSPLAGLVASRLKAQLQPRGICLKADLADGFEAFVGRLSANGRSVARRRVKEAATAGAVLELAGNPTEIEEAFHILCVLHQERNTDLGRPGCFASPRFVEFHRTLARVWCLQHRAVIAVLRGGGAAVAAVYGFVHGETFYFYQCGTQTSHPVLRSPGISTHLLLMQALARRGVHVYDFLRGEASYKNRLTTADTALCRVLVERRTPRLVASSIQRAAQHVAVRFGPAARTARGAVPTGSLR